MTTPMPGRRTVLLAGLGVLAGCTVPPPGVPSVPPGSGTPATSDSVPAAPSPGVPRADLRTRLMSFNVLTSIRTAADFNRAVPLADVALSRRAPAMAEWIRDAAPDVIGLQENEANSPAELPLRALAPLLPDFTQVLSERELPFLVRTAAYEVGESGYKLLSRKYYARYLSWCWLTHRVTGQRLLVANTHLDPYQRRSRAKARSIQVDRVIRELRRLNPGLEVPTVLLGDLNTRSNETRKLYRDPLVKLPRAGLRNAARVAARDASVVRHAASKHDFGTKIAGKWRYRAIALRGKTYDYAFVSKGIRVRSWQVVTGPGVRRIGGHPYFADGPVPSDHCPVQVELDVPVR